MTTHLHYIKRYSNNATANSHQFEKYGNYLLSSPQMLTVTHMKHN